MGVDLTALTDEPTTDPTTDPTTGQENIMEWTATGPKGKQFEASTRARLIVALLNGADAGERYHVYHADVYEETFTM